MRFPNQQSTSTALPLATASSYAVPTTTRDGKVADITVAEPALRSYLTLDDGAAFKIALAKDKSGTAENQHPSTSLPRARTEIVSRVLVKIYVKSPQSTASGTIRHRTWATISDLSLQPLRTRGGSERYREVLRYKTRFSHSLHEVTGTLGEAYGYARNQDTKQH